MDEREASAPQSPQIVLLTQVVDIREAINWIAHGNFAGSSFGPRLLFEFSGTNETLEHEGLEDLGREQLAFDLLWNRAQSGDIKIYGKKAGLTGDPQKPESRYWDIPENDPEPIPPEVLASAAWTEDDDGGIEGEEVSYWSIAVDHADLLTWFPSRGTDGSESAVEKIRGKIIEAVQSPSSRKVNALASVESKCRQWMAELAAQGVVPRSRDDLFSQALSKFPEGLTRRGFDRCWDNAAPESWKRAGRKPRQE